MSILKSGFLSPDINTYVLKHRGAHADEFGFADELNASAHAIMAKTKIASAQGEMDSPRVMAAMLFVRAISNFQGCILLCERGLIAEARTLARACFETTACLSAIATNGDLAIERMVESTIRGKKKRANSIMSGALDDNVDEEQRQSLRSYLQENAEAGKRDFPVEEMAKLGGLHALYIFYRQLSADAAHPNIEALERYFDESIADGRQTILWGPEVAAKQLRGTVLHACCFLLTANITAHNMFGNGILEERLRNDSERYKNLLERYGEDADAE